MTIANTSTPVTVLPSPHHGGLGLTRSLGRLGIPVFNVDLSRWCPSFFSRYSKGRFVYDLDDEVSFFAWDDPLHADVCELFSNHRSKASTIPPFDLKSAAELKSTAARPKKQACL